MQGEVRYRSLISVMLFLYCMALFPAVLRRTEAVGFDAPIYWRAANGDVAWFQVAEGVSTGWSYSDRLLPALRLLGPLPYPVFLFIIHALNALGLAALMYFVIGRCRVYPILAGSLAVVLGAKASDIISGGNVTGLLCGLSLTPWGALAAAAVKPYFAVALVLHAAVWSAGRRRHHA